jgi:polyhydroxybutyrate depolymerase
MKKLRATLLLMLVHAGLTDGSEYLDYPDYRTIEHDGATRSFTLHVPADVKPSALVMVMHGYMGSVGEIMDYSGFNDIADREGFIVVYPEGTIDQHGHRFFNVGYDDHATSTVDDLGFISSLTSDLQKQLGVTPERTFIAGMSNGGDMAYFIACNHSELYAAMASVTGVLMKHIRDECIPAKPLPVLQIHGTDDAISYFDGDIENKGGYGAYLGVRETVQFWAEANGLTEKEVTFVDDRDQEDATAVLFERFFSPKSRNEVWFYSVQGGGHRWPMENLTKQQELQAFKFYGPTNRDISASHEVWRFFEQYLHN